MAWKTSFGLRAETEDPNACSGSRYRRRRLRAWTEKARLCGRALHHRHFRQLEGKASIETLERRFAAVGARLKVANGPGGVRTHRIPTDAARYFDLRLPAASGRSGSRSSCSRTTGTCSTCRLGEKSKFLCGHDERHWVVAAVPEAARCVSGVAAAKAALQPQAVRELVERKRPKDPFRRRNAAYVRQGEWFFLPAAGIDLSDALALRDEPLTRGRGTPHVMQFAYRRGGDVVYANHQLLTGISEARYAQLTPGQRRGGGWMRLVRDPEVYAKGSVRHPDHATVHLAGWHRVLMNTEQGARAMRHVAFLD